jgi:hypothetical protein
MRRERRKLRRGREVSTGKLSDKQILCSAIEKLG